MKTEIELWNETKALLHIGNKTKIEEHYRIEALLDKTANYFFHRIKEANIQGRRKGVANYLITKAIDTLKELDPYMVKNHPDFEELRIAIKELHTLLTPKEDLTPESTFRITTGMNHCINCGNNIPEDVTTCWEAGYDYCEPPKCQKDNATTGNEFCPCPKHITE